MVEEIVQLKQKIIEILQENYRLRQTLEVEKMTSETTFFDIINDLLKVYDNAPATEKEQIIGMLAKYQVIKIPLAMVSEENEYVKISAVLKDSSKRNGVIVESLKDGFAWNNKVLRKAEVVVVKN
jgi:molecular chaperone GrpE (heat shock protein)